MVPSAIEAMRQVIEVAVVVTVPAFFSALALEKITPGGAGMVTATLSCHSSVKFLTNDAERVRLARLDPAGRGDELVLEQQRRAPPP